MRVKYVYEMDLFNRTEMADNKIKADLRVYAKMFY